MRLSFERLRYSLHRERVDVAQAADVEVAGGGVMDRVRLAPVVIRHQREHAEHGADEVVEPLGPEERAVAAVVLEHEEPDQHEGGGHREQERQPVADLEAPEHREPERGQEEPRWTPAERRSSTHRRRYGASMAFQSIALLVVSVAVLMQSLRRWRRARRRGN